MLIPPDKSQFALIVTQFSSLKIKQQDKTGYLVGFRDAGRWIFVSLNRAWLLLVPDSCFCHAGLDAAMLN